MLFYGINENCIAFDAFHQMMEKGARLFLGNAVAEMWACFDP